jgi:hypothetical protein
MLKYQALINKFNNNLTIGQYNSLDEFKFLKLKGAIVNLQILTDIYKNYYDDYKNEESSDLMINLFGLLQSLFVSIDSLYELSFALFNNKHQVNINQNEILHDIKYIRNDVVGHPTNRMYYKSNALGISFIDFKNTNYELLKYTTYKFIDDKKTTINKSIDILKTMEEFFFEASLILEEIDNLYSKNIKIDEILNSFDEIFTFDNNQEKIELIDKLQKRLYEEKVFTHLSKNRIIWRLNLLKDIINFKSINNDINYLFTIAEEVNKHKITQMINNNDKNNSFEIINQKRTKNDIIDLLIKNKKIHSYLKNLHDKNHPHYYIDLYKIIELTRNNPRLNQFFVEFKNISENNDLIPYAIGYIIKNIKKY